MIEVPLGVGLCLLLHGPIGVGVGAHVRNQIAAVVAALTWTFLVEQVLSTFLPQVGKCAPGGASSAVLQLGDLATTAATCCRCGPAPCCSCCTPSSCRWSVLD